MTTPQQRQYLLRQALRYAGAGISVFATSEKGKTPSIRNVVWAEKLGIPLDRVKGGFHQASTDPDNLKWQFDQWGSGGIGMPCGKVNDVIVLDLDLYNEKEGRGNAHSIMDEYRDEIGAAHCVKTQSGGMHVYFKYQTGHSKGELGDNIDVQTDGSYVLLPPSKRYKVSNLIDKADWEFPPWEGERVAATFREMERRELSAETPPDVLMMIDILNGGKGGWHNAMVQLTAHLVGCGWNDAEILQYVIKWQSPGFNFNETFQEVSVALAGARAKWDRAQAAEKRNFDLITDLANGILRITPEQRIELRAALDIHIRNDKSGRV